MSFRPRSGHSIRMGAPPPQQATVEVDVAGVTADLAMVDLLARMALSARRRGCGLLLRGAAPELVELIDVAGLSDVLPAA
jgi:ABC-type transporter Mla MlaB component